MKLTILEENGAKHLITLEKAVTRVGSSPANDICLRSPGISPVHLQIFYNNAAPAICKIANLAAPTALRAQGNNQTLPPYGTTELRAGDEILLESFRLVLQLPITSATLNTSQKLSAEFFMHDPTLRPETPAVGRILLKNIGERPASQFHITISGIPQTCYQIDPVPLLYPGAQEEVNVRFMHRHTEPTAGFHTLTITVSAPGVYPGEQTSLQQGIYVLPHLGQHLQILDDMPAPQAINSPLALVLAAEPIQDSPAPPTVTEAIPPAEAPAPEPVAVSQPQPDPEPQPAPKLFAKPKVIRPANESYWDEE
jgi:hypothetical protein